MGFVRKRASRTKGIRYQAAAHLDGARLQLGMLDTFALATDAWQHRRDRGPRRDRMGLLAGRRSFDVVAEEHLRTQQVAASTRKSCTSHVRRHLLPRFGSVPVAAMTGDGRGVDERGGTRRSAAAQPHRTAGDAVVDPAVGCRQRAARHQSRARRAGPGPHPAQWPCCCGSHAWTCGVVVVARARRRAGAARLGAGSGARPRAVPGLPVAATGTALLVATFVATRSLPVDTLEVGARSAAVTPCAP